MIYLSGCVRDEFRHPMVGHMLSPAQGHHVPEGRWWAADNACFPTGAFSYDRWLRWLRPRLERYGDTCLFVVVPDMPFNDRATIARFAEWHDRIAAVGKPLAFVSQNGMGVEDVPWGQISTLFVGGDDVWKTGHESAAIVTEAKRRGKWAHMGRVNSLRRLQVAASMGCDSADGTFLKYGPDVNWPRLVRWLDAHQLSPPMVLTTG